MISSLKSSASRLNDICFARFCHRELEGCNFNRGALTDLEGSSTIMTMFHNKHHEKTKSASFGTRWSTGCPLSELRGSGVVEFSQDGHSNMTFETSKLPR